MKNRINAKDMILAALLIALSIVIPIQFGFLKIIVGPFTATIASHVPMFIAMLISPRIAAIVGVGSGIGFLLSGMPMYVVFRAFTHIIVGIVGSMIIAKKKNFNIAMFLTAPLHGILEGLVIIPFGFSMYQVIIVTALGTIFHHLIDGTLSFVLIKALSKARNKDIYSAFNNTSA